MIINLGMPTSLATVGILTGLLFTAATANAAPEIAIKQSSTSSTTVVEQYSGGQVATITATPTALPKRHSLSYSFITPSINTMPYLHIC